MANDKENVQWLVKRYDMLHTCQNDIFHNSHCQANSWVVGEIIKQKFVDAKRIYTPKDIISDMKNDYEINLSYQQTYWSKEKALKSILGDSGESYNLFSKYSHVLQELNSGTIIQLAVDDDYNFLYYFLALGSCIKVFMQSIRRVIVVDGFHLKGKYGGTLLIVICLDENNQMYHVVIGIVNSENNASWE